MATSKLDSMASPKESEATDDSLVNIGARIDKSRRYLDAITSRGRALNLSRRDRDRERRINNLSEYTGHARRKIIDRREKLDDRRV